MENYKLVLPEHLNHYGYLFGGALLKWVDEVAYIAATQDYPGCNFVTIGMDRVEFRQSARQGSILRFDAHKLTSGRTSAQYSVQVFRQDMNTGHETDMFYTKITFVRVDGEGNKIALPKG